MKKIIFLLLIFLTFSTPALAQESTPSAVTTATPSAAPSTTPVQRKAQDLLDRVATKVAQIAKTNSKTFHGNVKSKTGNTFIITTSEGDKTIATNDATDFYRIKASKRSETSFANIAVGEDMVAIGVIDPGNKSMTASQVITKIKRTIFVGPIEAVSGSVVTIDGNKIDLADASYESIDSDGKIAVAKIGDFTEGKTAFVLAHSPEDETYSSLKALVVAN